MNIDEAISKRHQLDELILEHRALDALISQAVDNPGLADSLEVRRMKKRKLQIKDAIERIRSSLIPDLDA